MNKQIFRVQPQFDCKIIILSIFFFLPAFSLFGISFLDVNLSDDRLIYKVNFENQSAVFVSQLPEMPGRQLTAFPERLHAVNNGRTIIAISRFGAMSIPVTGGLPSVVAGYPSFAGGSLPLRGRLQEAAFSKDGRWMLFLEPVSPGYGNLVLTDLSGGTRQIVSERVELPASDFPARWSPNSQYFIYSKGGRLFYYPINNSLTALVDERFRMIGPGGINSILWGQQEDLFYFTGNTLYRIINPELFTRTMFGDFLAIGNIAAVLPMDFNPNFDRYWIAPDAGSVLINRGGKNFFLFLLGEAQYSRAVMPHIAIPGGAENVNVFWASARGAVSVLTIVYSLQNEIKAWRIEITGTGAEVSINVTEQTNTPSSATGSLSPNGARIVFWGESGLELWDYISWQLIQRLSETAVLSCVWANNIQLITGNSKFIEEINVSLPSFPRRKICLSGADEIRFEESTRTGFAARAPRILARIENDWFATDGRSAWTTVNNVQLRTTTLSSERFRVFIEPQNQGHFRNILMLRDLQSFSTISPFSNHTAGSAVAAGSAVPGVQTHGRQMQVALCFDLYDDDTGLSQVLAALRQYDIKATFFLNGDFIRRNPQATRTIAEAGHETASMFFAPIDFSDARYLITEEFIIQGLARNEDEFKHVTGRELSAIWHPPFFRSSTMINAAAAAAGYYTVTRSIDPGDWFSREDALRLNMRQIPPSEMIEQIMEQAVRLDGAVIPIRLGLLPGGRDEYLFSYIDVLLDALIRAGFEIVPVSAVIRR